MSCRTPLRVSASLEKSGIFERYRCVAAGGIRNALRRRRGSAAVEA